MRKVDRRGRALVIYYYVYEKWPHLLLCFWSTYRLRTPKSLYIAVTTFPPSLHVCSHPAPPATPRLIYLTSRATCPTRHASHSRRKPDASHLMPHASCLMPDAPRHAPHGTTALRTACACAGSSSSAAWTRLEGEGGRWVRGRGRWRAWI